MTSKIGHDVNKYDVTLKSKNDVKISMTSKNTLCSQNKESVHNARTKNLNIHLLRTKTILFIYIIQDKYIMNLKEFCLILSSFLKYGLSKLAWQNHKIVGNGC